MIDIVAVLPNIQGQQRNNLAIIGERSVGIGSIHNLQVTLIVNEPCPPTSKQSFGMVGKLRRAKGHSYKIWLSNRGNNSSSKRFSERIKNSLK
tara:strand:+ start:552 stop:830 length:279 start_codon:yes stop_codon:yes gene_type:complete